MDATWKIIAASSLACMLSACDKAGDVAQTDATATSTPVGIANTPAEQCDPIALAATVTTEAKALGEFEVMSIDGTYTLGVSMSPDPVQLNELFMLHFSLPDKRNDGSDIEGPLSFNVDASMPQHGHGMTVRPRVGFVRGDFPGVNGFAEGMLIHMPGKWKIYIDITEGAITERAMFDIEVH